MKDIKLKDVKKGMVIAEDDGYMDLFLALEDASHGKYNGSVGYTCKMRYVKDAEYETIFFVSDMAVGGAYDLRLIQIS